MVEKVNLDGLEQEVVDHVLLIFSFFKEIIIDMFVGTCILLIQQQKSYVNYLC